MAGGGAGAAEVLTSVVGVLEGMLEAVVAVVAGVEAEDDTLDAPSASQPMVLI